MQYNLHKIHPCQNRFVEFPVGVTEKLLFPQFSQTVKIPIDYDYFINMCSVCVCICSNHFSVVVHCLGCFRLFSKC